MNVWKALLCVTMSSGLLLSSACSNGNPTNATGNSATPTPSADSHAEASSSSEHAGMDHSEHKASGGTVVESGAYRLELVTAKEGKETHLHLFVQKGDQQADLSNALIQAQVQLPDGRQQSAKMDYKASGKYYMAKVPTVAGEYKVVVQSQIDNEKINARYTFKQ